MLMSKIVMNSRQVNDIKLRNNQSKFAVVVKPNLKRWKNLTNTASLSTKPQKPQRSSTDLTTIKSATFVTNPSKTKTAFDIIKSQCTDSNDLSAEFATINLKHRPS
uniref:(northern house mosquito) hypothetical protein n=1 Tax=Culex pipiens TaxID=7175 RepID=A0A8D8DA65_CULPI